MNTEEPERFVCPLGLLLLCRGCLIVVLLICGCGNSSSKDIVPETMTHQLYIDVDFEGNLLLDCYDVDVVFDDQTIGITAFFTWEILSRTFPLRG